MQLIQAAVVYRAAVRVSPRRRFRVVNRRSLVPVVRLDIRQNGQDRQRDAQPGHFSAHIGVRWSESSVNTRSPSQLCSSPRWITIYRLNYNHYLNHFNREDTHGSTQAKQRPASSGWCLYTVSWTKQLYYCPSHDFSMLRSALMRRLLRESHSLITDRPTDRSSDASFGDSIRGDRLPATCNTFTSRQLKRELRAMIIPCAGTLVFTSRILVRWTVTACSGGSYL